MTETMEEAARRLLAVLDARRRPAAASAAKIEPASASNGLAEDAARGGVCCLGRLRRCEREGYGQRNGK